MDYLFPLISCKLPLPRGSISCNPSVNNPGKSWQKELKLMKSYATLINTSRGPVVDEKTFLSALKKEKIASAGLDVYEEEPK
jgi:hypothetical protein